MLRRTHWIPSLRSWRRSPCSVPAAQRTRRASSFEGPTHAGDHPVNQPTAFQFRATGGRTATRLRHDRARSILVRRGGARPPVLADGAGKPLGLPRDRRRWHRATGRGHRDGQDKDILGIPATEVHDLVTEDGEPVEDTLDWYAQDSLGNPGISARTRRNTRTGKSSAPRARGRPAWTERRPGSSSPPIQRLGWRIARSITPASRGRRRSPVTGRARRSAVRGLRQRARDPRFHAARARRRGAQVLRTRRRTGRGAPDERRLEPRGAADVRTGLRPDRSGYSARDDRPSSHAPARSGTAERHVCRALLRPRFVFAVTQVTALTAQNLTPDGVLRSIVLFWMIWWAWTQFTWTLNPADTTHVVVRVITLAATAAAFVMATTLSQAFLDDAVWFAIPYPSCASSGSPSRCSSRWSGPTTSGSRDLAMDRHVGDRARARPRGRAGRSFDPTADLGAGNPDGPARDTGSQRAHVGHPRRPYGRATCAVRDHCHRRVADRRRHGRRGP